MTATWSTEKSFASRKKNNAKKKEKEKDRGGERALTGNEQRSRSISRPNLDAASTMTGESIFWTRSFLPASVFGYLTRTLSLAPAVSRYFLPSFLLLFFLFSSFSPFPSPEIYCTQNLFLAALESAIRRRREKAAARFFSKSPRVLSLCLSLLLPHSLALIHSRSTDTYLFLSLTLSSSFVRDSWHSHVLLSLGAFPRLLLAPPLPPAAIT